MLELIAVLVILGLLASFSVYGVRSTLSRTSKGYALIRLEGVRASGRSAAAANENTFPIDMTSRATVSGVQLTYQAATGTAVSVYRFSSLKAAYATLDGDGGCVGVIDNLATRTVTYVRDKTINTTNCTGLLVGSLTTTTSADQNNAVAVDLDTATASPTTLQTATTAAPTTSPPSTTIACSVNCAPAAPSAPTMTITGTGSSASGVFTAPFYTGSTAITSYRLTCSSGLGATVTGTASASPVAVTGLTTSASYTCTTAAYNTAGWSVESSASSAFSAYGPPAAPTINSLTVGSAQVIVAFSGGLTNGSTITNYQYSTNSGSTWTTLSPASTTSPFTISGLTNGTTYGIALRAVNAGGSGTASAVSSATPYTTPGAPTINSVTAGNAQVVVAFSAGTTNGSTITNYEYSTNSGSTWTTLSPASTTSPFTISGLTNGTTYGIALRAVNAGGSGTASAVSSATPYTTPGAPTITSTSSGASGVIYLYFSAPASNGGSALSNYQYSTNGGSTWTTRSPTATSSPITVSGLSNGTTYSMVIRAVNAAGSGSSSAAVSAKAYTLPAAPTVAAEGVDRASYLGWNSNGDGGDPITSAYITYASQNGAGGWDWTTYGSVATSGSAVIGVNNLARNPVTYQFNVVLCNSAGCGPAGSAQTTTPWSSWLGYQEILPLNWGMQNTARTYLYILQGDRHLVEYGPGWVVRWAAVRSQCYNNPNATSAFLGMQADGNLVLYCAGPSIGYEVGWASSFEGVLGQSLLLRDTGEVCLMSGPDGFGSFVKCW